MKSKGYLNYAFSLHNFHKYNTESFVRTSVIPILQYTVHACVMYMYCVTAVCG